ncbi:CocE/NonD family hydrolase [Nocardia sp. NPDC056000]|uniref:CocE/NonD family hydrolase n=1 Tax=Nocardia sp. NPDC056000 TaxID=3345674 RepID=UPI0035E016D4
MGLSLRRSFSGLAVVAAVVAAAAATPVAQAAPDGSVGGDPGWTVTQDAPPKYPGVHIDWDVPITMSDGVVLKANVYRPMDADNHIVDTPLPTILNMTPYTKLVSMLETSAIAIPGLYDAIVTLMNRFDLFNLTGTGLAGLGDQIKLLSGGAGRTFAADPNLIRSGYTQIVADVRGTGFSQGDWGLFSPREHQDTVEMIDWAAQQPWSDGNVGMSGISYSGINQLYAAEENPPALKAIFPIVPGSDIVRDVAAPGGALGIGFAPLLATAVDATKLLPDLVSILNGRFDWKWLADRVQNPLTLFDLILAALTTPSIDNLPPSIAPVLDPGTPFRSGLLGHPDRIKVPTFVVGGWHDIFSNSEPRIFEAISLPTTEKKLLMGDWYHSTPGAGLGVAGAPPRMDVLQRAWFDHWLKGIDNGIENYSPATLFQQGGGWTTDTEFPRAGMTYARQYLSADASGSIATPVAHDGSLSSSPPTSTTALTVSPGLSTVCSRDAAQGTAGALGILDICAKDSRISEVAALTFTGNPVTEPTLISGSVNVHLNTVLDATDGYWTATLNDVAPDGQSTVLTSGQSTASLRANDETRSKRSANGDYSDPYPILSLATRQPIVPGEPTVLDIGLEQTDAILQPGHRLRVDIYASNFPRGLLLGPMLNESGLKPQRLVLDPSSPSFINLPSSRPI